MSNLLQNLLVETGLNILVGPERAAAGRNNRRNVGTPGFLGNSQNDLLNGGIFNRNGRTNAGDELTSTAAFALASLIDPKGTVARRLGIPPLENHGAKPGTDKTNNGPQVSGRAENETDSAILNFDTGAAGVQQNLDQLMNIGGTGKIITYNPSGAEVVWTIQNRSLVSGPMSMNAQEFSKLLDGSTKVPGINLVPNTMRLRTDDKQTYSAMLQDKFDDGIDNNTAHIVYEHEFNQITARTKPGNTGGTRANPSSPGTGGTAPQNILDFVPKPVDGNVYITSPIPSDKFDKAAMKSSLANYMANYDNPAYKSIHFVSYDKNDKWIIWNLSADKKHMEAMVNGKMMSLTDQQFVDAISSGRDMKNEISLFSTDRASLDTLVQGFASHGVTLQTVPATEYAGRLSSPAPANNPGAATPTPGNGSPTPGAAGTGPATGAGTQPNAQQEATLNSLVERLYTISEKWGSSAAWTEVHKDPILKQFSGAVAGLLMGHVNEFKGTGQLGRYLKNPADPKSATNDEAFSRNLNTVNPFNNGAIRNLLRTELTKPGVDITAINKRLDETLKTVPAIAGTGAAAQAGNSTAGGTRAQPNTQANNSGRAASTQPQGNGNKAAPVNEAPAAPVNKAQFEKDFLALNNFVLGTGMAQNKNNTSGTGAALDRRFEKFIASLKGDEFKDAKNSREFADLIKSVGTFYKASENYTQRTGMGPHPALPEKQIADNRKVDEARMLMQDSLRDLARENPALYARVMHEVMEARTLARETAPDNPNFAEKITTTPAPNSTPAKTTTVPPAQTAEQLAAAKQARAEARQAGINLNFDKNLDALKLPDVRSNPLLNTKYDIISGLQGLNKEDLAHVRHLIAAGKPIPMFDTTPNNMILDMLDNRNQNNFNLSGRQPAGWQQMATAINNAKTYDPAFYGYLQKFALTGEPSKEFVAASQMVNSALAPLSTGGTFTLGQ